MKNLPSKLYISVELTIGGKASGKIICGDGYAPQLFGVNAPFEMGEAEGIAFDIHDDLLLKKEGGYYLIEEYGTTWFFPKKQWRIGRFKRNETDYIDSWTFSEATLKLALGEL